MKTFIRLTCLAMLLSATATGWAEAFKRGAKSCDFSGAENYYKQDPNDLSNQVFYASCLIIKGNGSKGLPMLYGLADQTSSVTANSFLANYLQQKRTWTKQSTTIGHWPLST